MTETGEYGNNGRTGQDELKNKRRDCYYLSCRSWAENRLVLDLKYVINDEKSH